MVGCDYRLFQKLVRDVHHGTEDSSRHYQE